MNLLLFLGKLARLVEFRRGGQLRLRLRLFFFFFLFLLFFFSRFGGNRRRLRNRVLNEGGGETKYEIQKREIFPRISCFHDLIHPHSFLILGNLNLRLRSNVFCCFHPFSRPKIGKTNFPSKKMEKSIFLKYCD